ncbi:MAG TPA: ATPase, T2SS/T4P/T4SS family [Phycisphaerales bacterium]|nr:ATPase, T2SS/T4P/T4SS family [Phycisphaerales bacterium]HRQ76567.1 ATPase, T2SS/T4P/T4SS family [Phycisphaerales bacterium]
MSINPTLAQTAAILMGWWQALLIVVPFILWARLISTYLEKDARYFHLNWQMWNAVHIGAGIAALAAMLLIPIFWVSWPLGVIILVTPILVYWKIRNASVPESQKFYLTSANFTAKLEARRAARAARDVVFKFIDSKGQQRKPPLKEEPLHAVHMVAEDMLGPALAARASRVEMVVSPKGTTVAQTVDGLRFKREPLAVEPAIRVIDFFKDLAGLDVADRRRPQAGDFRLTGPAGNVDVHIETAGSANGQQLKIDFNRAARLHKPFDGLGLRPEQMAALQGIVEREDRHGVVLVGSPAGHGLNTTMYSLVNRHDAFTSNIKTLERDIQVELDGVDQVLFDPTNPDIDYATNLQSILRRDPDIVMTDLVLDSETARIIAEPGMNGPLIYVPQQLPTIPDQVRQWFKQVGDPKLAAKGLRAVVNQRLVRSLCPQCRQSYQPTAEQLRKLGIPANRVKELFRASGKIQVKNKIENCPVCSGSGYLGQTGIFEVFLIDDEARKLLAAGDLKGALAHARRNKMIYLQEAALAKVIAGETTIEEVIRVTSPPAAQAGGASKSQPSAPAPGPAAV